MIRGLYPALISAGLAIAGSMILTGIVLRHAIRSSMLDHPNERSAHSVPTPRGGGLAICAVVLAYLLWSAVSHSLPWTTVIGIGGGAALVAISGLLDDFRSLSPYPRLLMHLVAAIWTISWLGGFPFLSSGGVTLPLGVFGPVLAVLGLVWATNLFNFMDGIDGIAAIETIWVAGAGGLLLIRAGNSGLGVLALVLAGGALGFLRWNWPPARIFLGDVGSGFIGFMLGSLAVASENTRVVPLVVWAMLFSAFIVDATITLARRVRSGHWHQPHNTHAYQRAVQAGWTHRRVDVGVSVLNLALALIALAAVMGLIPAGIALLGAFGLSVTAYVAIERIRPFR
jgi:Fuc2NAc and GlcNAc transferase